jgi:hypothetical protein
MTPNQRKRYYIERGRARLTEFKQKKAAARAAATPSAMPA